MKAYLVERPARDWCQDYAMVISAQDERHAERKARVSSDDFNKCQEITITEIDMNNGVNYTIISKPSYITFECPF